jgi:hypothetical protein
MQKVTYKICPSLLYILRDFWCSLGDFCSILGYFYRKTSGRPVWRSPRVNSWNGNRVTRLGEVSLIGRFFKLKKYMAHTY